MLRKTRRGFSLIEILIVVVIISMLAALIIPRLFGVIETANLAEAYATIGALGRAQQRYMDTTFTDPLMISCANPPASCGDADLTRLGLVNIRQNKFKYSCLITADTGYCIAYRWIGGAQSTARVYTYFHNATSPGVVGLWNCGIAGQTPSYVRKDTGIGGYAPEGVGCRANF